MWKVTTKRVTKEEALRGMQKIAAIQDAAAWEAELDQAPPAIGDAKRLGLETDNG